VEICTKRADDRRHSSTANARRKPTAGGRSTAKHDATSRGDAPCVVFENDGVKRVRAAAGREAAKKRDHQASRRAGTVCRGERGGLSHVAACLRRSAIAVVGGSSASSGFQGHRSWGVAKRRVALLGSRTCRAADLLPAAGHERMACDEL